MIFKEPRNVPLCDKCQGRNGTRTLGGCTLPGLGTPRPVLPVSRPFPRELGKGSMTSGGHYVPKILRKTRNSSISFIYSLLWLPSSYVAFENSCSRTAWGSWELARWSWFVPGEVSGAGPQCPASAGPAWSSQVDSLRPFHFSAQHQELPADGAVSKCVCLGVIYTSPWKL